MQCFLTRRQSLILVFFKHHHAYTSMRKISIIINLILKLKKYRVHTTSYFELIYLRHSVRVSRQFIEFGIIAMLRSIQIKIFKKCE